MISFGQSAEALQQRVTLPRETLASTVGAP